MGPKHLAQRLMKQVCRGVVGGCCPAGIGVDTSLEHSLKVGGELVCEMHPDTILTFGVENLDGLLAVGQCATVSDLTMPEPLAPVSTVSWLSFASKWLKHLKLTILRVSIIGPGEEGSAKEGGKQVVTNYLERDRDIPSGVGPCRESLVEVGI